MTTKKRPSAPATADFSHTYAQAHAPILDRNIEAGLWSALAAVIEQVTEPGGSLGWVNQARCGDPDAGVTLVDFFPVAGTTMKTGPGAATCGACPVRDECGAGATAMGVRRGIRAGQNAETLPRRRVPAATDA